MAQVVLEQVCKVYPGGVRAVDDVSLHIADREFVVLVGPSGCGKSTTLRMVAGLEDISSGTIRIGDRVVNEVAPKDRNIAMVFQNYALYPHMTVYRNMAFGLILRRRRSFGRNPLAWLLSSGYRAESRRERDEIDRKVRHAAQLLGLTDLLARRPRQLSGGQRQRVAVGRAIVREPQAYLFDEPLSNLDARLRIEMRAELKRLHRRVQTTTIYVTHDQEEAMTLGDRVVVMHAGRIQQVGTPHEVYERPVNRFVAGFLGTPPMNFLEGRFDRDVSGRLAFVAGASPGAACAGGANALPLPDEWQRRMAAFAGQPITLGVRPEALGAAPFDGCAAALRVRVEVVEPLGDRTDLHVRTQQGELLKGRVDARVAVAEGGDLDLYVDTSRVHFFEPQGAQRNVGLA